LTKPSSLPRLFALDQNFPQPIVDNLRDEIHHLHRLLARYRDCAWTRWSRALGDRNRNRRPLQRWFVSG
jgi:hypothetical protein